MVNNEVTNKDAANRNIKISACLVVYNEEKNIRRCLASLRGVVDEIIVVHDVGCRDKTLEICREYGAKIFIRPHLGIAEVHSVFAINQTQGDWLLKMDADEFLSDELRDNLRRLVDAAEINHISAYSFCWLFRADNYFIPGVWRKPILFKKLDLYYFTMPQLSWQTRGRLEKSRYILGHMPKDYASPDYWIKQKKWAKIQAEYILKNFEELDNFQAEEADWVKVYSFSRRHAGSLFLPILKFLKSFLENILRGAGLQNSWRDGLYNFYLGKDLYDLIHHR